MRLIISFAKAYVLVYIFFFGQANDHAFMRVISYKSCGICSCFPSELSEDNCYPKKFFFKKDFA